MRYVYLAEKGSVYKLGFELIPELEGCVADPGWTVQLFESGKEAKEPEPVGVAVVILFGEELE